MSLSHRVMHPNILQVGTGALYQASSGPLGNGTRGKLPAPPQATLLLDISCQLYFITWANILMSTVLFIRKDWLIFHLLSQKLPLRNSEPKSTKTWT